MWRPVSLFRALALALPMVVWGACTPAPADESHDAPESAASTPETSRADSLIDAWIDAAGGMDAWHDVNSARYTVMTVWYDSTGTIERMRPRRVEMRKTARGEEARVERPEAEGLYVQVYNGDEAWATLNEAPLAPDSREVEETEYVARDVVYWFGLPYKLKDPGVNRSARALDEGGFEVAVTFGDTVGAHPGDRYFYYFIDSDPFPEEVHYIEQDRTEQDRNRTTWSDFEHAGDLVYVGQRLWRDSLGQPTKALRMDDVWLNPPLPDDLFERPR